MKRFARLALALICIGGAARLVEAQRLNVDPAHPYSGAEQKQNEQLYKKSLKQQEKAQKKAEKARRKEHKKQLKEGERINQARQKQIDRANRR
jgi:IMP dehydrogenase/GMP reductase